MTFVYFDVSLMVHYYEIIYYNHTNDIIVEQGGVVRTRNRLGDTHMSMSNVLIPNSKKKLKEGVALGPLSISCEGGNNHT